MLTFTLGIVLYIATLIGKSEGFQVGPYPGIPSLNIHLPVDDETFSPELPPEYKLKQLEEDDKRQASSNARIPYATSSPKDDAMTIPTSSSNVIPMTNHQVMKGKPIESGITTRIVPPNRKTQSRKRIGLDDEPSEYWFDNRIHTFGNTGFYGGLHSAVAPFTTWLIDTIPYDGLDVRSLISHDLYKRINTPNARVLDLCCGVGMSTRALSAAFQDASIVCGIDTSPEMIEMARFISKYRQLMQIVQTKNIFSNFTGILKEVTEIMLSPSSSGKQVASSLPIYARGNAERVRVPDQTFDLVTIMYAFHEIPKAARYRILREARRLLKDGGTLAVVDICVDYKPSAMMLAGEPYVLEYKDNIMQQMDSIRGFCDLSYETVVPGHVQMWLLSRKKPSGCSTARLAAESNSLDPQKSHPLPAKRIA